MIGAVILLAAVLSAGNAEFDRNAAEGAARIAARRVAAEIAEKGPGDGFLRKEMLSNPGDYTVCAAASDKCRALFAEKSERLYEERCRDIRRRLELPDDFELKFTDADRKKLDSAFPRVFEEERRQTVAEQAKGIVSAIRPSEADFESLPEERIRAVMTERVVKGQAVPVFEENRLYISKRIVEPMIAGAYAARRRQREYLMRARCEAVSPSRLTEELTAKLADYAAANKEKEKDAYRAWGVFPSVLRDALPAAVERRTLDRLVSQVEILPFKIEIEDVEWEIAKNPAEHVKMKESGKKFSNIYSSRVLEQSLAAALRDVPVAERRELAEYLNARLRSDIVSKAVERVIRREVMPKWKAAREAAAARQVEKIWPALANGTWFPPSVLADKTAARSDYASVVRNWRKVSELGSLASADGGKPVLEESLRRADAQVATAFDRARNAIAAQNAIAEKEYSSVLAELRTQGERPGLKSVVDRLSSVTQKKWDESRVKILWQDGNVPENADEQHRGLFPSVRRKIELLAKAMLEELQEPQPETEKKEQDETQDSTTSDETVEEKYEYTISVSRSGERVEVKLLKGRTPVVERNLDAKFAPFGSAMKEVSDRLGRDLLKLR